MMIYLVVSSFFFVPLKYEERRDYCIVAATELIFAGTTPGGQTVKRTPFWKRVTSLRNLLEHKSEEEAKQKRIIKGLAKITQNKSEKQPSTPAPQDPVAGRSSEKKERARTNNGAKRKQHLEVEVVEEEISNLKIRASTKSRQDCTRQGT